MYSLRIQLLSATIIAAAGGASVLYYQPSFALSILLIVLTILISNGVLYFFVYRPLQKIQKVVKAQEVKDSLQRANVNSSDEFQQLTDSLNVMLNSFRADIRHLEKLERVRTEFLSNVSHELRTPLFSTQGLIETLLHGAIDDKKVNREFLKKALNNIERLNLLLEELIDISRIESGEMKLRLRYFNIVPLLGTTITELQPYAEQRDIFLVLNGPVGEAIDVYGDKERLRQVLVNLIENAIKYSEPKDTVTVTFVNMTDKVSVTVEDTGIGIAPQHISRIFERFYRVDKDRSRDVGGSGLGLAIVKHIIEAHDQTISVESEVGIGTKFSFAVNKSNAEV